MEQYLKSYPPILSVTDVAHILGVTNNTVRTLIKKKEIHSIRVGKLIKVPKNKLIAYLDQKD